MPTNSDADVPTVTLLTRLLILYAVEKRRVRDLGQLTRYSEKLLECGVPFVLGIGKDLKSLLDAMKSESLLLTDHGVLVPTKEGSALLKKYLAVVEPRAEKVPPGAL